MIVQYHIPMTGAKEKDDDQIQGEEIKEDDQVEREQPTTYEVTFNSKRKKH